MLSDEQIKHFRGLLETGQKMALSTKDIEHILDEYELQSNCIKEQNIQVVGMTEEISKLTYKNQKLMETIDILLNAQYSLARNCEKYRIKLEENNILTDE